MQKIYDGHVAPLCDVPLSELERVDLNEMLKHCQAH
jgi:hypothetical protein